jgi:hypothetical protein
MWDRRIARHSDGHKYAILIAGERVKSREQAPIDEAALKLYPAIIAYAGTYKAEGNKVIHHVVIRCASRLKAIR